MQVGEVRTGRALEAQELKVRNNAGRKVVACFQATVRPFEEKCYPSPDGGDPVILRTTPLDLGAAARITIHVNGYPTIKAAREEMRKRCVELAKAEGLDFNGKVGDE